MLNGFDLLINMDLELDIAALGAEIPRKDS
jgi:hypothetical protein